MDLKTYNQNKVAQMLPQVVSGLLGGNFIEGAFSELVTNPNFPYLDPMLHIFADHTGYLRIYNGTTMDMFRAFFNLTDPESLYTTSKESAELKIVINIEPKGIFDDIYENAPIIDYLKHELENVRHFQATRWASENMTDLSALLHLEGINQPDIYVGYCEKKHAFCIFIKTENAVDMNSRTIMNTFLVPIFLQLQAIIVALYPTFINEAYHPAIEQEYNHQFYPLATARPEEKEFSKHYEFIPYASIGQALEDILLEQARETEKYRMDALRIEIADAKTTYDDRCMELERLSYKIKSKELELLVPQITDMDLKSMANDIASIPEVQYMEFGKNSDNKPMLSLYIHGAITFDPDLLDKQFLRHEALFDFFTGLKNGDFMSFFSQRVSIRVDQNQNNSDRNMGIHLNKNELPHKIIAVQNPHLEFFGCMGTNKDAVSRARSNHNWVGLALQCVSMVRGVNLADSTVMDRFYNTYLAPGSSSRHLYIYTKDGQKMNWIAYYTAMRKAKENANG